MAIMGPYLFSSLKEPDRAPQCRWCGAVVDCLWFGRLPRALVAACERCWYGLTALPQKERT